MENLNAEQIIKALECCTRGRKSKEDRPCLDCPYKECNLVGGTSERQIKGTCQGWLMKDALALITSQEQRIKELPEENERLKALNENILMSHRFDRRPNGDCWNDVIEKAKADTVRKMQKILCEGRVSNDPVVIAVNVAAKELTESEKL